MIDPYGSSIVAQRVSENISFFAEFEDGDILARLYPAVNGSVSCLTAGYRFVGLRNR